MTRFSQQLANIAQVRGRDLPDANSRAHAFAELAQIVDTFKDVSLPGRGSFQSKDFGEKITEMSEVLEKLSDTNLPYGERDKLLIQLNDQLFPNGKLVLGSAPAGGIYDEVRSVLGELAELAKTIDSKRPPLDGPYLPDVKIPETGRWISAENLKKSMPADAQKYFKELLLDGGREEKKNLRFLFIQALQKDGGVDPKIASQALEYIAAQNPKQFGWAIYNMSIIESNRGGLDAQDRLLERYNTKNNPEIRAAIIKSMLLPIDQWPTPDPQHAMKLYGAKLIANATPSELGSVADGISKVTWSKEQRAVIHEYLDAHLGALAHRYSDQYQAYKTVTGNLIQRMYGSARAGIRNALDFSSPGKR